MAPRFVGALALAPVVAAADGFPDMASMHSKCYSLLTGLSASQYTTDELAMLCRQNLPMEVCRAEAKELGAKPWSPSTIGRVCGKWEEDWTDRMLQMTPEERKLEASDWQKQVDEIMKKKNAVGLCKDQPTMDQCAAYKKEEYPKYQKQLNDAYKQKRGGGGGDATLGVSKEDIKKAADESGATEQVQDAAESAKNAASEKMDDAAEKAQNFANDAKEKLDDVGASEKVQDAKEAAKKAADDAQEQVADAADDVQQVIDDNTEKFEVLKSGRDEHMSSSTSPFVFVAAGAAVLGVVSFAAVASFKRVMNRREALSEVESDDAELSQASS